MAGLVERIGRGFRRHDPEYDALRKAARAAIVIPVAFAISKYWIGGAAAPMFAVFGAFALLVFVEFPGDRRARAASYLGLAVVGAVFITVGTVVSRIGWLAVLAMFVIGVAVLFAGVLSSALSAATRAALLTFVLPVATPAPPGVLPDRLLGWAIALACCVPAALFLFAPRHHNLLRNRAARVCKLLADLLDDSSEAAASRTAAGDPAAVRAATDELQTSFLSSATRPVGLSAGGRAIIRVISDLRWLTDRLTAPGARAGSPELGSRVLRCAAKVLAGEDAAVRAAAKEGLEAAVLELDAARDREFEGFAAISGASASSRHAATLAVLTAHAIDSTVSITGRIVAWSAAADARPVLDRLLGRQTTGKLNVARIPVAITSPTYTPGYLRTRSVSLQNSLRGGLALALAVAVTELLPVHHGFWIVLGTLSVMRSTALTTGSNVLRAVAGTVVGFIVGAALIGVLGTGPVALWILMPFAVFLASFVPEMVSFAAGQTAFTVVVLIAFNLIAPQGYEVGLVRIEDVALGCAVAVVVSILLWPRSVANTTMRAAHESISDSARYVLAAVHRVTRHDEVPTDVVRDAYAATRTSDDALRQYLLESGGDAKLQAVLQTTRRANRVLLAAEAIGRIPLRTPADAAPTARSVVDTHAAAIVAWLDDADGTSQAGEPSIGTDLSDALAADGLDTARDLLWAAVYLNELELLGQQMESV